MITTRIAFRNIFRQRRRSLLTGLTMVGGIILLSLTISIQNGSYGGMIDAFTHSYTGHVQIHRAGYLNKPSIYKTLRSTDGIGPVIEKVPGVNAWAPRLFSPSLAFAGRKTTTARIIGIDPSRERRTTTIADRVEQGQFLDVSPSRNIMIGGGLAEILKLELGDELVLISQAADGSIANDIFTVTAILKGGNDSSDRIHCYMHIDTAQEFLVLAGRFHEIALTVKNYHLSQKTAEQITTKLKDDHFEVSPWEVVEADFYKTMVLDKQYGYIMLIIVMVIVALGVLNTVLMNILERTREFGVLKALGTRPHVVFGLIVQETILLSLLAIAVGLILSLGVNAYFVVYGIDYPEPIEVAGYTFTTINAELGIGCFIWPSLITMASAIFVCLGPAVMAMRTSPIDAMRAT